ncbi:MAG: hypothetical protein QXK37_03260 [Candidatus Woesearchaeota archaeon]
MGILGYTANELNISHWKGAIRSIILHSGEIQKLLTREEKELHAIENAIKEGKADEIHRTLQILDKEAAEFIAHLQALEMSASLLRKFELLDLKKLEELQQKMHMMHAPPQLLAEMEKVETNNLKRLSEVIKAERDLNFWQRFSLK